ncbi:MAG TPA: phosphatidylglycerol lysyltransferase domain-containing protein [Candidatus Sulfotelmatobacter sp.]|nr:phosphatidylglycerol lysyltransferase domain-containing protein [Candidatus Sulfotelmatobacter sp.]
MLQKYPLFSRLTIEDKKSIEKIVEKFDPYSDFNFTSLFSWDDGTTEISLLYDNLIIKMSDYSSSKTIYTLIGQDKIDETLLSLFGRTNKVDLVPEVVIKNINKPDLFAIKEDRDQFDYVYNIPEQINLTGGAFKLKRNKLNHFMKNQSGDMAVKKIDFRSKSIRSDVMSILKQWTTEREVQGKESARELEAIRRLFDYSQSLNLSGVILYIEGAAVGFSINEAVQKDYAICHFQKALYVFKHIDVFLSNITAKEMKHFGCKHINWEQDLGMPGLRRLKESYKPDFYLKKYTIEKQTPT